VGIFISFLDRFIANLESIFIAHESIGGLRCLRPAIHSWANHQRNPKR